MAIRNGRDPTGIVIWSNPDTKVRRVCCGTRNVMDEIQYALHKSLIKVKSFFDQDAIDEYGEDVKAYKLKEKAWIAAGEPEDGKPKKPKHPMEVRASKWMEDNPTDSQYSDIGHLDSGLHYVTLPNVVSKTILKAIDETVEEHNLRVPLGIAWITGSNWYHCH